MTHYRSHALQYTATHLFNPFWRCNSKLSPRHFLMITATYSFFALQPSRKKKNTEYCNTRIATHSWITATCSFCILQQSAIKFNTPIAFEYLMHARCNARHPVCKTVHCNTLQHTATHCNTLQHTDCSTLYEITTWDPIAETAHCSTLQHTATHCNTLASTHSFNLKTWDAVVKTIHCKTLQHAVILSLNTLLDMGSLKSQQCIL